MSVSTFEAGTVEISGFRLFSSEGGGIGSFVEFFSKRLSSDLSMSKSLLGLFAASLNFTTYDLLSREVFEIYRVRFIRYKIFRFISALFTVVMLVSIIPIWFTLRDGVTHSFTLLPALLIIFTFFLPISFLVFIHILIDNMRKAGGRTGGYFLQFRSKRDKSSFLDLLVKHGDGIGIGVYLKPLLSDIDSGLGLSCDGYLILNTLSYEWVLSFGDLIKTAKSLSS